MAENEVIDDSLIVSEKEKDYSKTRHFILFYSLVIAVSIIDNLVPIFFKKADVDVYLYDIWIYVFPPILIIIFIKTYKAKRKLKLYETIIIAFTFPALALTVTWTFNLFKILYGNVNMEKVMRARSDSILYYMIVIIPCLFSASVFKPKNFDQTNDEI